MAGLNTICLPLFTANPQTLWTRTRATHCSFCSHCLPACNPRGQHTASICKAHAFSTRRCGAAVKPSKHVYACVPYVSVLLKCLGISLCLEPHFQCSHETKWYCSSSLAIDWIAFSASSGLSSARLRAEISEINHLL